MYVFEQLVRSSQNINLQRRFCQSTVSPILISNVLSSIVTQGKISKVVQTVGSHVTIIVSVV